MDVPADFAGSSSTSNNNHDVSSHSVGSSSSRIPLGAEDEPTTMAPLPSSRPRSPRLKPPTHPSLHALSGNASLLNDDSRSNPPSRPRSAAKPRTPKPATPQGASMLGGEAFQLLGPAVPRSPDSTRPLNVTDALSYLDAVKVQFQDKPDVYNHFLDIMKDFKSQVIDTPGVIERVSMLFHGNPYLIQGFNTFLPPGYRIELSSDPRNMNTITVTTPMGTIIQGTNYMGTSLRLPRDSLLLPSGLSPFSSQPPFGGPPPPVLPVGLGPGSRPTTPMSHALGMGPSPFIDVNHPYSPAMQGAQTTAAASFLGNLGNRTAVERSPTAEFNHAVQFLNKIKIRYADEPDTYKQFLEILQTYQKEQRQLHEVDPPQSQVFAQVQMLFKGAPDLMEEFKDFLPEAMGPGALHGSLVGIMPHPPAGSGAAGTWERTAESAPSALDKKVPNRRRKRAPEKEPPATQKTSGTGRVVKKAKHNHKPEPASPKFSPYQVPPSPQPAQIHPQAINPALAQPHPQQPHTQPIYPSTVHPHGGGSTLTTPDELIFFDRTKKALESGGTYDEFLKLLNLYAKDVIDTKTLLERAEIFLGDGDLMAQFKDLMGWDDKYGNVEYGPPGSIRTSAPDPLAPRNPDDGQGPSYRRLPETEVRLACSGRDQLARSVLNDEWVSHPTWASEESGFLSHKKNSFEDTLHRSEEERHEYQVHIDAITRTIAVLDPLDARIEQMSPEERAQFKLKPDLGGTSRMIYHRIIKKIYGRDIGMEVIKALQDCPSVAVPVVLARLKQKCGEWRRLQREWSRTWREVDAKNFYKALDHQGISFKANDKKNITAKFFVQDIESIKAEQAKAAEARGQASITGSLGYQLEYEFHDTAVLHDSLQMIFSFLDHSQSQYSAAERRSIEKLLRSFIPVLFMFPSHEFNAACGPLGAVQEDDAMEDAVDVADDIAKGNRERSGRRSAAGGMQSMGVAPGDLRKRLLKTARETKSSPARSTGSASPAGIASPTLSSKQTQLADDSGWTTDTRSNPEDVWVREIASGPEEGYICAGDTPVTRRPFFANTTFYTLLRLLQLLYSRLLLCKEIGARMAKEKHASLMANPVAVQLGLDEPNGPSAVLAQALEAVGDARSGEELPNVLYLYLLDACEKVFENEMDQATFEEHMRWLFGTKAYHVFTVDRVITAIIKQVQTIMADNKCQDLWYLLQSVRNREKLTSRDIIRYRRESERNVGSDENLYRIDWDLPSRMLRIQLVGASDPSVDEDGSAVGRWREYMASYVMRHPTEWVPQRRDNPTGASGAVFLKRCMIEASDDVDGEPEKAVVSRSLMGVRVSLGTYKLFYESGTEDFLWRVRPAEEESMLQERGLVREEERRKRGGNWLKQAGLVV